MANLNKDQQFRALVFAEHNDAEKFDKINYSLNRIRNTFIADVVDFNKMKVDTQYQLCVSTYLIYSNSKRSIMKEISMFNKHIDDDIKKYDPDFGFVEPTYVQAKTESGEIIMIESL